MIRVQVRRKSGWKNLQLYYDDPTTGREISKSAGTADRDDALKEAARWEDELRTQRGPNDDGWEWFKLRFIDEHCANLSKAMRSGCLTAFKHYTRIMAPATVGEVTSDMISQFAASFAGEAARPRATVDKNLRCLKIALRWAARVGLIDSAPHVPLSKGGRRKFMRGRPITEPEYRKMLRFAHVAQGKRSAPSWRRLIELLWLSGLRIGEAAKLSWDSPPLQLQIEAEPYPQILFFEEGHKAGSDVAVPLTPDLAAWLEATPRKARRGLVAPVMGIVDPVTNVADISRSVAAIGKAAGIETGSGKFASAHDLRRAFGTRWAIQVPPVVLQRIMRHSTIETTLKYYVGIDASQIGAILWKGTSPGKSPGRRPKRA